MNMIQPNEARLHIRFEGQSWDLLCQDLDIGQLSADQEVRQAVAGYFDVAPGRFQAYVVERHANGNMTVRPEAVFG
jgi:hypothetical protein